MPGGVGLRSRRVGAGESSLTERGKLSSMSSMFPEGSHCKILNSSNII